MVMQYNVAHWMLWALHSDLESFENVERFWNWREKTPMSLRVVSLLICQFHFVLFGKICIFKYIFKMEWTAETVFLLRLRRLWIVKFGRNKQNILFE